MKFIVIGCGRVGAGIARSLAATGHSVSVVDTDPASLERLGPAFTGGRVTGVGFDRDVLLEAGVESADGLAAVTGSDEANVVIARLARRRFRVPRVVARIYDPRKAEIYNRLGVLTIAPVGWGIHRITELLTFSEMATMHTLGSGEVEVVDVEAPAALAGRNIGDVDSAGRVLVVAISRAGSTFIPDPGAVVEPGDTLHLVATAGGRRMLDGLLGRRRGG